jgi:RNA polymerase sigma-70 factor (ECF subfamily)
VPRPAYQATRRSLVERLANWEDQRAWQEFYETYRHLLFAVARQSGLTDVEAQEAVQETVIAVAKKSGGLRYDPKLGSFKAWLLQVVRWRIADQFRKRQADRRGDLPGRGDDTRQTATFDRLPHPDSDSMEEMWEREWQANRLKAALARLKRRVEPKHYQVFDCYVLKEWPVSDITRSLGVNRGQIYLIKHRLSALLKEEFLAVERGGDPA